MTTVSVRSDATTPPRRTFLRGLAAPAAIAVVSAAALLLVQAIVRATTSSDLLAEGYRFQAWSGNWMMQNLGLEDMAPFGPLALWIKHAYPPGLDVIRYILMTPEWGNGLAPDPVAVDERLYLVYAVLYGITNAIAFAWVRDLTRSWRWGLAAATLWALSPGHILLATLLEPSELSLVSVCFSYYFLYRFLKTRRPGYASAFLVALLVASWARSFIQIYVLIILVIAVISFHIMSNKQYRRWAWTALNIGLLALIFAYPVKQFLMFDTWSTTTFGGYHRVGMLHLDPRDVQSPTATGAETPVDVWASIEDQVAAGLGAIIVEEPPQDIIDNALRFSSRFNTQELVRDNYRLEAAANQYLRNNPVASLQGLAKSLTITIPETLNPTSMYTNNVIVESLPYRGAWDWLVSGWRLIAIIAAAVIATIYQRRWAGSLQLAKRYAWLGLYFVLIMLPIIFSNRYYPGREDEGPIWTDAVRQKMFLALPISVFVIVAIARAFSHTPRSKKPQNQSQQTQKTM